MCSVMHSFEEFWAKSLNLLHHSAPGFMGKVNSTFQKRVHNREYKQSVRSVCVLNCVLV